MSERLFKLGVDGWWLDATEPEIDANLYRGFKTAEGPGAVVFNAYPLKTSHEPSISPDQVTAALRCWPA
jgi:alpha-D-xyloside xylohydrolase